MKGRGSSPETRSTGHGSSRPEYDVFLSFRGPDTRVNFTDVLYYALLDRGISVFIDKQGIDIGEEIGPEIFQAIDDSKICIPIFSGGYASSSWCLHELEHMMECRKIKELEVMHIFYDVEPSDVKLETKVYRDALTLHEQTRGVEIVQRWAEALKEVTGIKGWDTKNIGHGELAHLIAQKVLLKLKVSCVDISDHLVGMDESVNEVVNLLNVESEDVRLIGLWGMGGIGKTTLAKVVYNKLSSNFDSCSFISDIREASQGSGMLDLLRQLISDVTGDTEVRLSSIDHGKNTIKRRFCRKRFLIFLDDVDHVSQLRALAEKKEWFGSGSRIVVTTRDKSVFTQFQDQFDCCLDYEVNELNTCVALQLFSKHAFRSNSPPNEFLSLSEEVIANTRGLPLAIEVIGSFLCGKKSKLVWQDTLKKIKYCQQRDMQRNVHEKLMLSYKALDHPQQQIFLDIACFLSGEKESYATYMWDDCGFFPNEGIEVLLLMSLVKIRGKNRLWMHDQLKDLGRSIVQQENCKDPIKGSRVWLNRLSGPDIVQQKKGTGTVAVYYNQYEVPLQDSILTSKDFIEVPNIRFLRLFARTLSGDFWDLFSELRWLIWRGCPKEMQATNFFPKNLVILNLELNISIDEQWGGWTHLKVATRLKVLNLSYCTKLKETPEFSAFLSLEELILRGCRMLTKLSNSIGMLKHLVELDVSDTSIVELPNSFVNLKSLKVLKINNCRLQKLPNAIGMMEELVEIEGEGCGQLEVFPSDIVRVPSLQILKLTETRVENIPKLPQSSVATRLKVLNLSNCRMLKETAGLSAFLSLEELILEGCEMLTKLSDSIGMMKYLVELDVSYTSIVELPNSFVNLKSLKVLKINNSRLQKLPDAIGLMEELEEIKGEGCVQLEVFPSDIVRVPSLQILKLTETRVESIPKLPQSSVATRLKVLNLSNCRMLKETAGLSSFLSLEKLILKGCEMLTKLSDSIGMMKYLVELDVSYTSIVELPNSFVNLKSLKVLKINNSRLQKLPDAIGMMEELVEIEGEGCGQLEVFPSDIVRVPSLQILKLTETRLENIPKLPQSSVATRLKVLNLSNCRMLKETAGLSSFLSLEKLILKGCEMLTKLSDSIGMMKYLVELDVSYTSIVELPNSFVNLKSLKVLKINNSRLQKLPDAIGMMEELVEIEGEGCGQLEVFPSDIVRVPSLQILKLTETRLENIPKLPQSSVATRLKVLNLSNCRMLKETAGLSAFLSLEELILRGCRMLTKLSNSIGMLKHLVELDVSNTSIVELPNSFVNLKSLKVLKINNCRLQKLPDAIGMMEELEEIEGEGCGQLEVFPSDIVRVPSLQILKLTETRLENIPKLPQSSVATRLKVLDLSYCTMLKETPELSAFLSLEKLILKECEMLTKLSESIGMLKYLVELDVSCTSIVELPQSIVNLRSLKVLKIDGSGMQKLPDAIGMMEKLEEIYGGGCRQLEMIPSDIVRLPSLRILKLTETCVENIPMLPQSLVSLCVSSTVLEKDLEISNLVNLRNLDLCFPLKYTVCRMFPKSCLNMSRSYCKLELSIITSKSSYLGCFRCLEELQLKNCDNLRCVGQLPSDLRIFTVTNCRFLEVVDLSNLSNFKNLKILVVRNCSRLAEIRGLDRLESLKYLSIKHCSPLLRLPDLSTWKELRKWHVDALATNLARGKQVARSDDLPL
ncbi:hypothetical protein ACJRO7_014623 [Eucalyptus globulus]|uniref:TIR domain-containing protein n=1 Tax=Eucalyptus globulus TaxID=34317 RepID=A0ABD3L4P3_EUCGL